MKRLVRTLFLAGVLMAALCATAWAAEATESGIYNVTPSNDSSVTITPNGTSTADVTVNGVAVTNFYAGADQLTVTVPANSGTQYLVLALDGNSTTPTEQNIVYIDQTAGTDDRVSFTVYPKQLSSGTYHIYVTSSEDAAGTTLESKEVGSFQYYAAYTLGNVDEDVQGLINIRDVMAIINHMTKRAMLSDTQILAADINKDNLVNVNDIMAIINHITKRVTIG